MAKKTTKQATAPLPPGTQVYIVTDTAPPKVAGKSVRPGDRLTLTDAQARFEEISGHIRRPKSSPPASQTPEAEDTTAPETSETAETVETGSTTS